jgi:hypothetical protein
MTSPDPSVEQLSTTIGRKPAGIRPRIQGNAGTSFRHGKITSTIWSRPYCQRRFRIGGRALQNEELKLWAVTRDFFIGGG